MTIQANQGFGVSVFGAVSGGGGGGGGGTPGGLDTQVQFNSSGSFGASAAFTFVSPALTIGTQQTTQGQIVFANTAAGAFATTVQSSNSASAAWTLTLPATAGTANYALTTNGSGVSSWSQISLTAGVTGVLPLANGGTNANLTASNGGIVYSGASAFAVLSGTATAGQMLRSGASGAPSWSTATFPSTATSTGTLLRADGTNWAATTATYPTTTVAGTLLTSATANTVSASATPTLGIAGTTAGTLALSGATSGTVTLQTAAAAGTGTIFQFHATNGASGTILTTTGSGVTTWSTATFPSTATSTGTILRADGTNWVATTATYPTTTTANQILYSSATNTVAGLTSANTSALVTSSSGVPSFTSGGTANRVLRTDGTTVSFAQVGLTTDVTGVLPVANGGTNASSASITAFNNITGYTASGATGTTSTNLVFSTSPNITTPTFTTSATGPLFIGGAGTTSTLTLRSTSGVGTTGSDIIFQTGNNGASEGMRITNAGNVGIGQPSPGAKLDVLVSPPAGGADGYRVTDGTRTLLQQITGSAYSYNGVGANENLIYASSGPLSFLADGQVIKFCSGGERMRVTTAGNIQATGGGLIMPAQGAPTSKGAAATLTGAELITGLLQYTGAADTITLPTGTTIEGALTWTANNVSLDWFVINTGSGTCTIGANGNTTVGTLTVAAGASGHFRIRRTATNTFTVYRMA